MKASDLKWAAIDNFSPEEWPVGVLEHMDSSIILALEGVREESGIIMRPSPRPDAHVREYGNSRHSTKGGTRLSDATDVFVPGGWNDALKVWQAAQRCPELGGIGIYVNKQWGGRMPMLHLDCRPERLLWVCRTHPVTGRDDYIYLPNDPALFFEVMAMGLEPEKG